MNFKYYLLCMAVSMNFFSIYSFQQSTSLSFFPMRPLLQYSSFLTPDLQDDELSFYLVPAATHIKDSCNFAPALLFGQKTSLICNGDDLLAAGQGRDIRAEFFGAPSDTCARISCCPSQSMFGALLGGFLALSRLSEHTFLDKWIIGFRTSITEVRQSAGLQVTSNSEQATNSIINFLSAANLSYGAFDNQKRTNIGIENLTIFLGSRYESPEEELILNYYSGLEIPTQSSAQPQAVFNPQIGNDGHWGFLTGFRGRFNACQSDLINISLFANIEGHFFIHKKVTRTCDLFNKPWSRYLPLVKEPLIGQVTLNTVTAEEITSIPVVLHPCSCADLSIGIDMSHNSLHGKIGYNLWARNHAFAQTADRAKYFFYNQLKQYGIASATLGESSSQTTIAQQAPSDIIFEKLSFNNIDYDSVGYPGGHSQSLFLSIGNEGEKLATTIGGWIEWGDTPFTMSRYGIWGQIGIMW